VSSIVNVPRADGDEVHLGHVDSSQTRMGATRR